LLAAALLGDLASAKDKTSTDADRQNASQSEIRLGMSADFSASARALSIELYRGAMAYLLPFNNAGGANGRRVVIKAYDDQYEPDLAIHNTLKLMDEDDVFALFSYVGTPTMNRTLPLLQMRHDKHFLLLFPFTGADTNRIPPYDQLSFNLRASYDQEMKGPGDRAQHCRLERRPDRPPKLLGPPVHHRPIRRDLQHLLRLCCGREGRDHRAYFRAGRTRRLRSHTHRPRKFL
jgi:hypothetical protein